MKKHLFFLAAAFAFSASAARAESQWRVPVDFAWTNDATAGYSMFLIGSHPDVGGWDYLHSIPLAWHEGNVWSATVGIQAGTDLEYKFIRRPTDNQGILSKPEDWDWFPSGPNLSTNIPAEANPPFSGKTALFLCPWDEPVRIHWSRLSTPDYNATNSWTNATMTKLASGRYITTFDEPDPDKPSIRGEWIRFTFSGYEDGKEKWYHFYGTEGTDHEEDLFSPLDAFYEPAVNSEGYVSNSRFEERDVYPWPVDETQGVSNRTIRIYLPRGYNENTNRSYPVLYFADGQNIFSVDPLLVYRSHRFDPEMTFASHVASAVPAAVTFVMRGKKPDFFVRYPGLWSGAPFDDSPFVVAISESGMPVSGPMRTVKPASSSPCSTLRE